MDSLSQRSLCDCSSSFLTLFCCSSDRIESNQRSPLPTTSNPLRFSTHDFSQLTKRIPIGRSQFRCLRNLCISTQFVREIGRRVLTSRIDQSVIRADWQLQGHLAKVTHVDKPLRDYETRMFAFIEVTNKRILPYLQFLEFLLAELSRPFLLLLLFIHSFDKVSFLFTTISPFLSFLPHSLGYCVFLLHFLRFWLLMILTN